MDTLLLVESPAKARKIQTYLPSNFKVMATFGHIIDLPKKELGIDVDDNFRPKYEVLSDKKSRVSEIKKMGKGKKILLAADADREGDAIAWHCGKVMKLKTKDKNRIIFREVSEKAITSTAKLIQDLKVMGMQLAETVGPAVDMLVKGLGMFTSALDSIGIKSISRNKNFIIFIISIME